MNIENIMGHREGRTSILSQYLEAISMFRTLRKGGSHFSTRTLSVTDSDQL